ncbi:uncharacterized protein LOC130568345 isoform X5 [Triplophysa rosa]|uniref:CMRF35-like molecule 1 n=1 Tax=Triplophysa rosa TaxID=992332 RepID=A0A9W7TJN8_TRIRA|nr:uncharacterized protein LOC130568345 isoform X5 [Triplophysa rosa]KAI7797633.1 putative CMRF35-like molecule 1 [Triplophysa rosa]
MKTHLRILSLFIVFRDVLMKSGNVYEGTVGQTVEIRCPVPDEYKYTPKYFCRDPFFIPAPVSSFSSTGTPKYTDSTWTKTNSSAYSSSSPPTVHFTNSTAQVKNVETNSAVAVSVVCLGVLLLLVFCFLVALVLLYMRRSHTKSKPVNPPDVNQTVGDLHHLYDELLTDRCVVGRPVEYNASLIYSTVQNCGPAPHDDVNTFYSLVTATNIK